jgi:hypothetical protein
MTLAHVHLHPYVRTSYLRSGPGHLLADVTFIYPLAASYLPSTARTPGHAAALRDAQKKKQIGDHASPQRGFGLGTSAGTARVPPASPMCTASSHEPSTAPLISAVPLSVPHAYGCCGPPHLAHGFGLDRRRAHTYLPGDLR